MGLDISTTPSPAAVADAVKDYYGKMLASSADLKTTACCTDAAPPAHVAAALARVHEEVTGRLWFSDPARA